MVAESPFASWPCYTMAEAQAVQKVLLSQRVNYWTGQQCRLFEEEFAAWCGARYAIAVTNGTVALEIALHALGIGPGDEVIVTPRTFFASVSCIARLGARPIFADVDAASGNLTAATVAKALTPRSRALICVHLAGWPCDMDAIMALANKHDLKVVEDCAQAHGALYKGASVGTLGHVGAWSFCQDKIITTGGEGGALTTQDEGLWQKMWSLKDHGKDYHAAMAPHHGREFRWLHRCFGSNARMLEMQAVLGRLQLGKVAQWNQQRTAHAATLASALKPFAGTGGVVRLPTFSCQPALEDAMGTAACTHGCAHAYYKFYAYVRPENLRRDWSRARIVAAINRRGVPCFTGSCSEVYLEKAFDHTPWRPPERLPVARQLGETSLMFLVHPSLTQANLERACRAITTVLTQASDRAP